MNISSEIYHADGSNSSIYLFHNVTEVEENFSVTPVMYLISALLGFPMNSYVIWLIVTGTGNGLAGEFFSLNLAVFDIFICVEFIFIFLSHEFQIFWIVVNFLEGLFITGRPLLQCLICVERYLAVVHPVTFLKFKPLRYRVICSVIVCVASFFSSGLSIMLLMLQSMLYFLFSLFAQFFLFLSFQLFCCLAVLRALKQSRPGERARERNEENHMKRRAFYLILISTLTMLILHAPFVILVAYFGSSDTDTVYFIVSLCFIFAGLVQPLLFLCRARKLPFFTGPCRDLWRGR